ncbi:MAG: Uma2 family endonuclease [Chloroflexaceae bacterium]|nr:Uma2 family endonuclease [Chloroflexaceae bacterium]
MNPIHKPIPVDLFPTSEKETEYPESDGKPMADNTLQFEWIVRIKENLENLFADHPDVFVAGNLFWYAIEGNCDAVMSPDVMVVFGRPKGYRGSYKQWEEDGIGPQVVFEILSPSNTREEMGKKYVFYEEHGVSEYYIYNPGPKKPSLQGYIRRSGKFVPIENMDGWKSPLLGITFRFTEQKLRLFLPNGEPFQTLYEMQRDRDIARTAHERERLAREQAEQQKEQERLAREQAEQQKSKNASPASRRNSKRSKNASPASRPNQNG